MACSALLTSSQQDCQALERQETFSNMVTIKNVTTWLVTTNPFCVIVTWADSQQPELELGLPKLWKHELPPSRRSWKIFCMSMQSKSGRNTSEQSDGHQVGRHRQHCVWEWLDYNDWFTGSKRLTMHGVSKRNPVERNALSIFNIHQHIDLKSEW